VSRRIDVVAGDSKAGLDSRLDPGNRDGPVVRR
jgi:hypothetical protein